MTTGGYERYGIYDEHRDRIYEHRASFMDDGRISMAYAIVYWDVVQIKEEEKENIHEVFYIWLRNNATTPILIDPDNLSLLTEKGDTIPLSPLTDSTSQPLKEQKIEPYNTAAGYAVFEIPKTVIESDKPSRMVYDDQAGNKAVRYLQIEDMKKYEGMVMEKPVYYYAPVYPRRYWYPYYYPEAYYRYNIDFFYYYAPYRHYYYFIPVKPKRREFYTPSPPGTREFRKSSGYIYWLYDGLFGGQSSEGKQKKEGVRKRREFP